MSELIEEFPSVTSNSFGFKSVGSSIQLVSDFKEKLHFKSINNLAYSPLSGLFVAAGTNDLVIGDFESLRKDMEEKKTRYETNAKVLTIGGINNVSFTKDDNYIVVSVGYTLKYTKISQDSYQSLDENSFKDVELASEVGKVITSYECGSIIYVLYTNGLLSMVDISTGSKSAVRTNVIDFDLSPIDGSIIILRHSGIDTLDSNGNVKISIDVASDIKDEDLYALAITWLKEKQYFVTYGEQVEYNEDEEPSYLFKQFIVDGSSSPPTFAESFDSVPAFGTIWRKPTIYRVCAPQLSESLQTLNILASSTSTDISPLTESELLEPLNDSERAALPMNKESGKDVNAIGLVLDTRSKEKVVEPCAGISEANWLPVVWSLGSDGKILGWYIFHVRDLKNKTFKADFLHALESKIVDRASSGTPSLVQHIKKDDPKPAFPSGDTKERETNISSRANSSLIFGTSTEKKNQNHPFVSVAGDLKVNLDSKEPKPSLFGSTSSKHSPLGFTTSKGPSFATKLEEKKENPFASLGTTGTESSFLCTNNKETKRSESFFAAVGNDSIADSKPFAYGSNDSKSLFSTDTTKINGLNLSPVGSTQSNKQVLGSSGIGITQSKPVFGITGFSFTETNPTFGSAAMSSNENKSSFGSSGLSSSGFGFSRFGSSGTFGTITNIPEKSTFGSTSSGFASFAYKPASDTVRKNNDSPFDALETDTKSASPFEQLSKFTNHKPSPFNSFDSYAKPNSLFDTVRSTTNSDSPLVSIGSQDKTVSPFAKLSFQGESENSQRVSSVLLGSNVTESKSSPFANFSSSNTFSKSSDDSKKNKFPFGLFGLTKGLESNEAEDSELEASDMFGTDQRSFSFDPKRDEQELEEKEKSGEKNEEGEQRQQGTLDEVGNKKEPEEDLDQKLDEGASEDYDHTKAIEEESFQRFRDTNAQDNSSEIQEDLSVKSGEGDNEVDGELSQGLEDELSIEQDVKKVSENKSVPLKNSDEEFYEKAKPLDATKSSLQRTVEVKVDISKTVCCDSSIQSTIETRDQEVFAKAEQSSMGVQTEPVESRPINIQAFEGDEIYAGALSVPSSVAPYVQLMDIKYPQLNRNHAIRELEKIIYDTDAELTNVEENSCNIGAFLKDHMNPVVKHTEKSLGHSYQWRISEVSQLLEISKTKLTIASTTKEKVSTNAKAIYSVQEELKSLELRAKNITEKVLVIEKMKDSVILNARDLPSETLLLQKKVRKHHGIVVSELREVEQNLLSLKAATKVLTEDFPSTNVLQGVVLYINDITRDYASDTKKLTEEISRLNNNKKIIDKLSSPRSEELKEKEFNNKGFSKLIIDNVIKRIATENKISKALRQRSVKEITSQF